MILGKDKRSKKAMSLAIVLLVLATLVLTVFSLFAFGTRKNDLSDTIKLANLERIHAKEEVFNFYVDSIMDKAVVGIGSEDGEDQFIQNFRESLQYYKRGGELFLEELNQVEEQLKDENIEIKEGKAFLNLNVKISDTLENKVDVSYSYTKKFEKEI
jgi:hypothetical protein